jgi:hypothetical protein
MVSNSTIQVQLHENGNYWQARYRDSNGVRQTRSLGSREKISKREAKELCAQLAVELAGTPGMRDVKRGGVPTLAEWLVEYMALRATEIGKATQSLHDLAGRTLVEWFGADRRLDRITEKQAALWRT